jgi:membrane protein
LLGIFRVLRQAIRNFFDDNVVALSAGLAFYSALSLAPLLMMLLAATEFLSDELAASVIAQIHLFVGERAGNGLTLVMESTRQQNVAGLIAGFGAVAMLLSATMAFTHLQNSLNRIWKVKDHRSQVVRWLLARAMSLGLVLGIGLLLLVSLMVTAALRFLFSDASAWSLIDAGASLLMYALLFGLIYWLLPSVSIGWRDVAMGAVVTAILFDLGKWGIGRYLSYASIGSVYGAAGSIMVLLVWIYYASIVFFFGAEITHAYARLYGSLRSRQGTEW